MASTNKTTNYELSQYIGTDKPTYLSDYNGDMYKIDAQMKVNADNIATAISTANTATTTANSANTTATTASSKADSAEATANSASTTATNAQTTANSALSTATTAQSSANSALDKVDAVAQKLNLVNFETISYSNVTHTGNGTPYAGEVYTATNTDGSIGKIYGRLLLHTNGSSGKITIPTQLRPKDSEGVATNLTVNGICISKVAKGPGVKNMEPVTLTIKANGDVEGNYSQFNDSGDDFTFMFIACVLFLTPFDDQPIPDNS